MFLSPAGTLHRRSNFFRRATRPCANGNLGQPRSRIPLEAIKPGLKFHGLRHSHKTWMIEDAIPEAAQCERLGHTLDDEVRATYSHVSTYIETQLIDTLQHRREKAIADAPTTSDISWRLTG